MFYVGVVAFFAVDFIAMGLCAIAVNIYKNKKKKEEEKKCL